MKKILINTIVYLCCIFTTFTVKLNALLLKPCLLNSHGAIKGYYGKSSNRPQLEQYLIVRGGTRLLNAFSEGILSNPIAFDGALSIVIVSETIIWLKIWTTLASKGILPSTLTRKIIHSGSVPLFVMHWPLYSSPFARYFAAFIPLLQIFRLTIAGLSSAGNINSKPEGDINNSRDLIQAVSRSGDKKEALQGPLIYSVVLLLATLLYFRTSPVGVIAVTQMAVGDGLADIVGRRWGTVKWPFAGGKKSVIGSAAFVLGSFVVSAALLLLLQVTGSQTAVDLLSSPQPLLKLLAISALCAAVELIPGVDDNISVPAAAAILSWIFFVQ